MTESDLWRLSAAALRAGYASRAFSPVEVTRAIFARIAQLDPLLNAFLACNRGEAMQAAAAAERAWSRGGETPLLCGIPVSVKDTIEMAGLPTTYGSLAFVHNHRGDAEVVRRLRGQGAVILGKTNTPEFALHTRGVNRLKGPGRNPWNPGHGCGGSSGGAAAAVAAGLGPVAIGTDSAGSVRLPAAYNGVFGLKPSFQRIPDVQAWRASPGRGHIGVITRAVGDAAMTMAAIAGPDDRDPDSVLTDCNYLDFRRGNRRGLRIAVSPGLGQDDPPLPAEVKNAVAAARDILEAQGCEMHDADPPVLPRPEELAPGVWAYAGDHYSALEALEPGFWPRHEADLTDYVRPVLAAGAEALAWQYRTALRRNADYRRRLNAWFGAYDFLLCAAAGPAPALDQPVQTDEVRFLASFNHAHLPAAVIPIRVSGGLPIAVQIVGRRGDDVGVLRIAAHIEAAAPFAVSWPDLMTRDGDR